MEGNLYVIQIGLKNNKNTQKRVFFCIIENIYSPLFIYNKNILNNTLNSFDKNRQKVIK